MSRAMPNLNNLQEVQFIFPWAYYNFSGFLNENSPWMTSNEQKKHFGSLFQDKLGCTLSISNLEGVAREMVGRASSGANNSGNISDIVYKDEEKSIFFFCGSCLGFDAIMHEARSFELAIIHEPYQIKYAGSRFPDQHLDHIHPKEALIQEADAFVSSHSGSHCSRIGLHIRRGDYREWQSGGYFYDDDFWVDIASRNISGSTKVYIFTNEQQGELVETLVDMGCILSEGDAYSDMARLMLMDSIYGPPSTFPILARMLSRSYHGRNIAYSMLEAKGEGVAST
jgi:hypothetical protein